MAGSARSEDLFSSMQIKLKTHAEYTRLGKRRYFTLDKR